MYFCVLEENLLTSLNVLQISFLPEPKSSWEHDAVNMYRGLFEGSFEDDPRRSNLIISIDDVVSSLSKVQLPAAIGVDDCVICPSWLPFDWGILLCIKNCTFVI